MLSMYDATIPPLKRALNSLSHILKKGEEYADAKKADHSVLLNARLYVDMYPLIRQVQIATDMAKGAGARLAGIEIPAYEDNETSFAELQARIAKTVAFLDGIKPEQLTGSATRQVSVMVSRLELKFTGQDYLLKWVNPNVYFHVTTAYNILRHLGVELGKKDFLRLKS
ncbi:MAG TPA: DUF1993 domain-containing protein [Methylophilus sp.]|mgnify:FL=1|nr:DUF1993 domain-containing protein [Methylophilus sp.]HQQ32968.1 DUF1993 domain-containing protein [Methylophilus sp.]